jgi:hypothetical protein
VDSVVSTCPLALTLFLLSRGRPPGPTQSHPPLRFRI